jgi:hypothetical protein
MKKKSKGKWETRGTAPFILDLDKILKYSASRPRRFRPGESAPRTNYIQGCVGTGTPQDTLEKIKNLFTLSGIQLRYFGRLAHTSVTIQSQPIPYILFFFISLITHVHLGSKILAYVQKQITGV